MDIHSTAEITKEIKTYTAAELQKIILRLARYKKENKELIGFIIFKSEDKDQFIIEAKKDIDLGFSEVNKSNLYLAKKTLRKILRTINKYIKFSADPVTELELRIYYCNKLKQSGIPFHKMQVLQNL